MTLSPRIKVYNDIACRAVGSPDTEDNFHALLVANGCQSPEVQARAAKIQASVVTIMSVLSSGSTGLWSQRGDVSGRKFLFCVSIIGFMLMDLIFVLVSGSISAITRRGEVFILLGPAFEGFCGGFSVFDGVFHAYISDCTPDGSRSRIFSAVQGIVFVGRALGPWIAGVILPPIDFGPYSWFYLSIAIQGVLLLYVIFLLPESLRSRGRQSIQLDLEPTPTSSSPAQKRSLKELIQKFINAFISPITIFRPRTIHDGASSHKDYSLTLLGSALFLYINATAVYQLKYMYAQHTYRWDSVQLGYYMSLIWITRAINLLILLPVLISYLKPKTLITGTSTPESIALELQFDRRLARASLSVEALGDVLVIIAPTSSQLSFIAASCLSSFTSGGNPALHSLGAVCLQALGYSSETGRLFGAVGVLNAIAHSIAPAIFAATYSHTVSTYPKTIFCLAATLLISAVTLLGGIRMKAR
ncbi:major facilitator superfamily domain-containing protein [Mycena sanguinolenta]|nr:major facilitator superfamily domain-containing protein [Mycena sanguinolenta]